MGSGATVADVSTRVVFLLKTNKFVASRCATADENEHEQWWCTSARSVFSAWVVYWQIQTRVNVQNTRLGRFCLYLLCQQPSRLTSSSGEGAVHVIMTYPNASASSMVFGSRLLSVSGSRNIRAPDRPAKTPKIRDGSGAQTLIWTKMQPKQFWLVPNSLHQFHPVSATYVPYIMDHFINSCIKLLKSKLDVFDHFVTKQRHSDFRLSPPARTSTPSGRMHC